MQMCTYAICGLRCASVAQHTRSLRHDVLLLCKRDFACPAKDGITHIVVYAKNVHGENPNGLVQSIPVRYVREKIYGSFSFAGL